MKNAFVRFSQTCVQVLAGGGLMVGALLAGQVNPVTVTLPHAVTIGSTTLPSGQYTISSIDMRDGDEYFIVRGEHTPTVTLQAQRIEASTDNAKQTEVVFSEQGDQWHFDKMFLKGGSSGYQFVNGK